MTLKVEPHKGIVFIFFMILLGLGMLLVKDYGIAWDEAKSREHGATTINYIVKGDQKSLECEEEYHGPFFETILVFLEKDLRLTNNLRAVYLMRHIVTFLMFYLGVIFFYKLCNIIFRGWQTALLGCMFLILSPRIFADAFYNSKDIPCLSLFILSTYTLINYLNNKTFVNALIHALASAILIDIRIVGFIIPFLTLLFTSLDICMVYPKETNFKQVYLSFFTYGIFLILFTIFFWPFLWASPLNNFIYALSIMSHFKWDHRVLYLGQYIQTAYLPWHYIPVWIAISTPLTYVITFCIGYVRTIMLAGRNFVEFYRNNKSELIILLLISLPMLAAILFKPVFYDAWRHMFFVYPSFLVFSLIGLRALFSPIRQELGDIYLQKIFILMILFNLSSVVLFMIRNHPYQNVYFNSLAGWNMKEIKNKFELDYWGLSYTKALEYIAMNDPDRFIKIYVDGPLEGVNTGMLSRKDSQRLEFVKNLREAKYFLSDYRWHNQDYNYKNEFYSVKVDGASIAVVYRL